MRRHSRFILALLLLTVLLTLLSISTYFYINYSDQKEKASKISVIVYGSNSDRWATLKHGIDLGAADFGAEVSFVTMNSEADAVEQEMLLKRELDNGAEGIVLAAVDSRAMSEVVSKAADSVPVIMIETDVEDEEAIYISADNYSMGLNIGRSVLLNGNEAKNVAILMNNKQRGSIIERYQGLTDCLQNSKYKITLWEMGEEDTELTLYLQNKIKSDSPEVIIALDDNSLEAVVDAFQTMEGRDNEPDIDIYGIGSTNKIVYYLDNGLIKSIVFQNEFNMGYLSIQEMFHNLDKNGNASDIELEFRTVNKDTMYLPKNQRLVFPIVQ